MSEVHWVVQENIFRETAYAGMIETLDKAGIPYTVVKVVPFVGEIEYSYGHTMPEDGACVICMGSYSMRHAARERRWSPGVFDLEPFTFEAQVEHWGEHMLNYGAEVVAIKDAKFDGIKFLRPIEDSKSFAGGVMDWPDFSEWRDKILAMNSSLGTIQPDHKIVVSDLKEIYRECRFWVVQGRIVTASTYKVGTIVQYSNSVPYDLWKYIEDRIKEWQPHSSFVIDGCETSEGMRIVEINTLNSSGFYACDGSLLIQRLHEAYSQ